MRPRSGSGTGSNPGRTGCSTSVRFRHGLNPWVEDRVYDLRPAPDELMLAPTGRRLTVRAIVRPRKQIQDPRSQGVRGVGVVIG